MQPAKIAEIYEVMAKVKHGENVDKEMTFHILKDIVKDESNYGLWIKREVSDTENYLSFVIIGRDSTGEKKVVGYRVEIK